MAPSLTMTNCPTCGCGAANTLVADVEWGICAIPSDGYIRSAIMCRLCDYISFKKKQSGTLILEYNSSLGRHTESASPIALQAQIGQKRIWVSSNAAFSGTYTPDSVRFIEQGGLPAGYCYDSTSRPRWEVYHSWPSSAPGAAYIYAAPYSHCDSQTWSMCYCESSDRVTVPSTDGASVTFYTYYGTGGYAYIHGWLACTSAAYQERNYCGVSDTPPEPLPSGECTGYIWRTNAYWFRAELAFYVKGTLTYHA